jgi:Lipopolysaccharide-assembly
MKIHPLLILLATLLFAGCGIYSFTGGKPKDGLRTVSIELFENNATIIVPTLAQDLTEKLKDKFISQSNLQLLTYDGDMQFSGKIINYNVAPIAIQGNESAAQNRLTLSLSVKYNCTKYPDDSWEQNFSQFADFSSNVNLSDVEEELIKDLIDRLTTDIFNKSLANW